MEGRLRVVHVEDTSADSELLIRALTEAGYELAWARVETEEEFLQAIDPAPDVVLADYQLPAFSGIRALELLKERLPDVPLIVVSGTIGEEKAVETIRLGAVDYVLKDRQARLPTAIRNAVAAARERLARRHSDAALREREAGLRHAQAMAKLAHVVTGEQGEFESWSENLPRLVAVLPESTPIATREWLRLVHPGDRARFRAAALDAYRKRARTEIEYRLQRHSGVIHVRQTMEPLGEPGATGRLRWFNTLQDITESKLAEERIRRLNRVHAVLSGINGAIVRVRAEAELLEEACRVAVESGRFVMAWIGLVDEHASLVRPVAAHGRDVQGFLDRAPLAVLETHPDGRGLAGRAIRAKAPMLSNDVKNDSQRPMREELESRGINSLAILPLIRDDEPIGVLALYASDVGFFDEEEVRLLGELAGDVSYALDHIAKARKVDYLSYYDPLTGLANRALFHERLKMQIEDAARKQERLALLVLDVERFRRVTDGLGRQAGDAVLVELAKRLPKGSLPTSWYARLEADHFTIVMPGLDGGEEIARRGEKRYVEVFGVPFEIGSEQLRLSARYGIALFPEDARDADTLLRNAEAALKKAKVTGERYVFYTEEMTARVADKLALEGRLRQALDDDEFVLHYQPKYEANGRTIAGLEALIRWRSPDLGLVPPAEFVPLLEETGLIVQAGAWALRRAARDHRAWAEAGLAPPRVAVNVSAIQLRQRDFVEIVERSIAEGVSPTAVDLELTETLIMDDIQATIAKLKDVRRLGVGIAIDDFGTGYSSLYYLARLPVQALKIDRSFVATMAEDPKAMTLIQTMVSLAHSLDLKVVAEGVEKEEQAKFLRLLQCDQMQGYLLSKPLTAEHVVALLKTGSR